MLGKILVIIACIVAIVVLKNINFNLPDPDYNLTDAPEVGLRSGLEVYMDYDTGCQYVYHKGGLSIRYAKNQKPMCGNE